jgi:hypothetical protein
LSNESGAGYFRGSSGPDKKLHTEEDLEGVFARNRTAKHDDFEDWQVDGY